MKEVRMHRYVDTLKRQFAEGRIGRRDFPWSSTMLLGLAYRTGVPWNESEYSNPEFDALPTKAEGILDVDKRREAMIRLEAIMQEDGPIVQPPWRNNVTFMDKRVKGFQMHPTGYIFANELAIGEG